MTQSTLTDAQIFALNTMAPAAKLALLGDAVAELQTNVATIQDNTASYEAPAACREYIGSRTVVQINALTPTAGWSVVATTAGTPTAGTSDPLVAGDVAEYDGTQWKKMVSANGFSFVPAGTRLIVLESGTLYSPLASGDEAKLADFDGTSNTPTLTTAPDGAVIVINAQGSLYEGFIYTYDSGIPGWTLSGVPNALTDADFAGSFAGMMRRTGAGTYAVLKDNLAATTNPGVTSDTAAGYSVGSRWCNVTADTTWVCIDATNGAAIWQSDGVVGPLADASFSGSFAGALRRTGAGAYAALKDNLAATANPTVTDDTAAGYAVGSRWCNVTGDTSWLCIDATNGAAIWQSDGVLNPVAGADFAGTYAGALIRTGSNAYAAIKHNLASATDPVVTDDSASDYAVGSVWVNTTANRAWQCIGASVGAAKWQRIGAASYCSALAAAADRITSLAVKTAFATTKTLPANLPVGTTIEIEAWVYVVSQNGADTNAFELDIGSVAVLSMPAASLATGTLCKLRAVATVEIAGAAGKITAFSDGAVFVTGSGTSKGGLAANTSAIDWTAANAVTVYDTQSAADPANQVDLRSLKVIVSYP